MAQSKEELNRKARERQAARRQTPEYREWLVRSRELRRALKAKYRRQAGAKPRDPQAAAEKRAQEAALRERREALAALHDAHVRRYVAVLRDRRKAAKRYAADPEFHRKRSSARKKALPDSYVAELLRCGGFPRDAIDAHVIGLKREVILFRRLSREAKKLIHDERKEDHEAIAKHP